MRLKHIRMTGFKSFVDPTTLPLPSNLAAIVGPNGCGKSNVIDAVRWVMGESSAKQLRGEAMSDVIFNGSTSRKPVGMASVELEFDNSDGSLGGEYARYTDISIKRQVTREGDSQYFLNGARCRRRDIIDIFLGTGLGPRSYAIIEQGMISRFIEAKPDDMRIYFEEVAGISKYKDRRHETELKIKHTLENLNRLNDIVNELEKQLMHLEKQAQAAERYRELKQEERQLKSQLHALRYTSLKQQMAEQESSIASLEARLIELHDKQKEEEGHWQKNRESLQHTQHQLQETQQKHYELGAQIAAQQQNRSHAEERKNQLLRDKIQIEHDLKTVSEKIQEEEILLAKLAEEIQHLSPQAENSKVEAETIQLHYLKAEESMQQWQVQWEKHQQSALQINQKVLSEQNQLQHIRQRIQSSQGLCQRLEQELARQNIEEKESAIQGLQEKTQTLSKTLEETTQQLQELKEKTQAQRQQNEQLNQQLNQIRREVQQLIGKKSSLTALQENALGNKNQAVQHWLKANKLPEQARLALALQVEPGWETAVETAMGSLLQAICLEEWPSLEQLLEKTPQLSLTLIRKQNEPNPKALSQNRLLSKVHSQLQLDPSLNAIYCAETLVEALTLLPQLSNEESIMTKDGLWLGPNWVRIRRAQDEQTGVLARKRELEALESQLLALQGQEEALQIQLKQGQADLQQYEQQREKQNQFHQKLNNDYADTKAQHKIHDESLRQQRQRREQITQELEEQIKQQKALESQQSSSMAALNEAQNEQKQIQENETQLRSEKDMHRSKLEQYKQAATQQQNQHHQLELRLQTCLAQQQMKTQNIQHQQQQMNLVDGRLQQLEAQLTQADEPILQADKALNELNTQLPAVNTLLAQLKQTQHETEQQLIKIEAAKQHIDQKIHQVRADLEKRKLSIQGDLVRCSTLEEQLQEMNLLLNDVISTLTSEANVSDWEQQLHRVTQRIERLGNINLAAIDELKEQRHRKDELDKQLTDLNQALALLQEAMEKIDLETKTAFQETYEKVNTLFSEIFPRLFGGGAARMEMTGDDFLTSGISVMAQPPGKRNSHIHLLSGGEKALTAVALVFALFHLNPAPFCMLDEVDAPLDDANVGRFCRLVKEMSQKVQFIFISHNKLAIEMGEQLVGVTMKEPGVSRLVAVDIQKAIEMAQT